MINNQNSYTMVETLDIIKESFEEWYNSKLKEGDVPLSIVINYSDEQKLSMKAFHTIKMIVNGIGIKDGKSFVVPLYELQENYNHGVTSEQEAKEGMTKKLLTALFDYPKGTVLDS